MLFCDDYETGNALGSHSGCNKLCGCYITLPCFPPQYQSSLDTIFHALLFYSKDRDQFGNASIFRLLIDQLNDLETQGLELELLQGKVQIYFKLGLIVGDNLGLHSILGFVESFNANYACRFCKMDKDLRSMASLKDPVYIRTKSTYEKDFFHRLNDFHVKENFAADIMHDVFEGVCMFDMAALLKHYVTVEKFFPLEQLNHRMHIHIWGATESNIPLPIADNDFRNEHLRRSAAEMLTFVRHFGLLVGDLVPEDDPAGQIYSILRQIINIILSPSVQRGCHLMLRVLIHEHHTLVRSVLKRQLKPKDHIFTHLPTIMAECGPPIHFWCMRFE
ncbi:GSCOCG00011596001-RA-CDS, partial [Cotesia congregata]